MPTPPLDLRELYRGPFAALLGGEWAVWRRSYLAQVERVQRADAAEWMRPDFQQELWDHAGISTIGPGQSVTLVEAYADQELGRKLLEARSSLQGVGVDQCGAALQALYDEVLAWVYPRYTPRRPKARLVRLLAAIFPENMSCLMDAGRTLAVQRLIGAARLPGDFVAQNPSLRDALRSALGQPTSLEENVEHAMFAWYLWEEHVDKQDEGAVAVQPARREANAVPPFSLLPASAQRRSLASVKDNVALLVAMLREAENGISRDDLITTILAEASQLNASSAANMISQAQGGLGLLRLDGNTYRPTERGLEMLASPHPVQVLRGPLVGRVFGMGHLLRMVQREPGKLTLLDAANRLKDLVPTWTTAVPGSYICGWAKTAGLVQVDHTPEGGRLTLTDEGEDYAAALPDDFEDMWRIEASDEPIGANLEAQAGASAAPSPAQAYGTAEIIADGCFMAPERIAAAIDLLRRKKNLILQGPPGTGKTWLARRLGYALLGVKDPSRVIALQFQPSLSYEDFVRGWRPDGKGGLQLADGVFLDAIAAAKAAPHEPFVLVIEEINRGNPAQILGEMLTLIEDGKRRPEEALRLAYPRTIDERVYVPDNLHIIGTMNLADRSLALVDLALRRRFSFLSLTPQLNEAWRTWSAGRGCPADLLDLIASRLGALNAAIAADASLGEQFQVGHSFVTPNTAAGDWMAWYGEVVDTEIAPLLHEYWYDRAEEAKAHIARLRSGA